MAEAHPAEDLEEGQRHSSHDLDFRRRSLALAQLASINTSAANSLHYRHTHSSSSLNPNSAYSASSPCNAHADFPMLRPSAQLAQQSPDKPYYPGQEKSLSGIAERALILGITLAVGSITMLWTLLATSSPLWRVPFFLSALSIFHFLEFWTTAKYNTPNAAVSSFLLNSNGRAYIAAHTSAFVEALLVGLLFPNRQWAPFHLGSVLIVAGLLLVLAGQAVRSAAMIQCGTNFNHTVQHMRARGHELVTTGIYATFRHPSYFGYFWWALGTQLVMGNVVCFFGFAVALWRFFSHRITYEEDFLVRFFGDEYVQYRNTVGTMIPFM
ncbi:Protein-S-isoprenylcysteine O-methyltransferase [Zalerion maritima]|uniref:Protein-S-isoprenylcysteine O-methyltransferase n=1 Tax=Zalerion maritima TaxID=339359 RepID=A0AAD5RZQ8_9PEZI|nr:Protein-S-isoprenylcysteine O-methyltransferase [Zalerion maritima]